MRVHKSFKDGVLVEYLIDGVLQPLVEPSTTSRSANGKLVTGLPVTSPGRLLALVIKRITGQGPCPAKCAARIRQMDEWGWWRCWRNRKTIAGWLVEEALRRGHQVSESNALDLLRAAFKELRIGRPLPALGKPTAQPLQRP